MKRFLLYSLLFSLPFWCLIAVYVGTDVFKVIYHYEPFYVKDYPLGLNRSYGSTVTFMNQNPIYHYDSFIFGNSRSLFYEVDTWKKYLPEGSSCFHYDAQSGSITGLHDKILFLDKEGANIKNALLVLDHELLSTMELKGYLFVAPPQTSGFSKRVRFHVQHVEAFLNPLFLISLFDYKLNHQFKPYMKDYINPKPMEYESVTNEIRKISAEIQISKGEYYDEDLIKVFDGIQHPNTYSEKGLNEEAQYLFDEIKDVFDNHHTDYKIVISPLYDQVKLNKDALSFLQKTFGKDRVYDFSGVNKWNADYHNYYEDSHYRPHVAKEIMEGIYKSYR